MRSLLVLLICIQVVSCTTRTTETSQTQDSVKLDTASVLATQPAAAALAYSALPGFTVKNTVAVSDTVNFFIIASQEEFDKMFAADKGQASTLQKPDFQINYVVGVVCLPTDQQTTITVDKVEASSDINVYVSIVRGEKQKIQYKPAQPFAIERRDGINAMQFFVNGKVDKALMLTVN